MAMTYDYDSEKIRKAARRVHKLSVSLDDEVVGNAHRLMAEADQLQGKAARAMLDRLEELERASRKICTELDDIGDDLNRYARAIEAVSEKLLSEV